MSDPIRILLVDDHEIVRGGLRDALKDQPDFEVVGEADTVAHALMKAARLRPDLVLLDVRLPDGSGVDACREIRKTNPDVISESVLIEMPRPEGYIVLRALAPAASFEEGAKGFLGEAGCEPYEG